jgi:hypothetical protein
MRLQGSTFEQTMALLTTTLAIAMIVNQLILPLAVPARHPIAVGSATAVTSEQVVNRAHKGDKLTIRPAMPSTGVDPMPSTGVDPMPSLVIDPDLVRHVNLKAVPL